MSGYNGRRGVNVSQYVADLNTIPSPDDLLDSTPPNLEADLALLANNDLIDWDGGDGFGLDDINFDAPATHNTARHASAREAKMDFGAINGTFDFQDFSGFQNPMVDQPLQTLGHQQPNSYPVPQTFTSPISPLAPVASGFDASAGTKRKLEQADPLIDQSLDEPARAAAEEDKRRRNTAASARFRVKKKQREQALEKTAKEMTDRVSVLETRIQQLETENAWLKDLITEKNGGKATSSEVSAMLKKHIEDNNSERKTGSRTDGVGTAAESTKA